MQLLLVKDAHYIMTNDLPDECQPIVSLLDIFSSRNQHWSWYVSLVPSRLVSAQCPVTTPPTLIILEHLHKRLKG